ncbi:hypothetical protein DFH07DRAFT_688565, partial [Mycena maculata]
TELDIMARDALTASLSTADASRLLYGRVTKSGRPTTVYLASSAKRKSSSAGSAIFAIYWGANSPRNTAYTFDGAQTEARASLFAILMAVIDSRQDQTLIIYTSSQYAIRCFCYWAGENAMLGWPCTHADVLQEATSRISLRSAPVEFRWL